MKFNTGYQGREAAIIDLFTATFAASEGEQEGSLIGRLARDLLGGTAERDRFGCTAEDGGTLVGAIVFSRLHHEQDARTVFVLGPVAAATDRQGKGIGQKLLAHGRAALRSAGADIATTYGDASFHGQGRFHADPRSGRPGPLRAEPPGRLAGTVVDETATDAA